MKFKSLLTLCIIFLLTLLQSCAQKEQTDWDRAIQFVKYHSSENYLKTIDPVFLSLENEHKSSDWVEYFFSVYSTRNWLSETDEYAQFSNEPVIPKGITFRKLSVDSLVNGKQLVISFDNYKNEIKADGYINKGKEKVVTESWKFIVSSD